MASDHRATRTFERRGTRAYGVVAVALAVVLAVAPPVGAQTVAKCASAKSKAAAKEVTSKLKCQQKAYIAGLPVDQACMMLAEGKADTAMMKINARGGCAATNDAPAIEDATDICVEMITLAIAVTTSSTSTSTTTTTLPGCPTGDGSPCGSCGSGTCLQHVDPSGPPNVCVDFDSNTGTACASDAVCGTGAACAAFFSNVCFQTPCP